MVCRDSHSKLQKIIRNLRVRSFDQVDLSYCSILLTFSDLYSSFFCLAPRQVRQLAPSRSRRLSLPQRTAARPTASAARRARRAPAAARRSPGHAPRGHAPRGLTLAGTGLFCSFHGRNYSGDVVGRKII